MKALKLLHVTYIVEEPSVERFTLSVEANIIGTDDVILEKRHKWRLGTIEVRKTGIFLILRDDGLRYIGLYRIKPTGQRYSFAARKKMRHVGEHLRRVIAPKSERFTDDDIQDLFESVYDQLVVKHVLGS